MIFIDEGIRKESGEIADQYLGLTRKYTGTFTIINSEMCQVLYIVPFYDESNN